MAVDAPTETGIIGSDAFRQLGKALVDRIADEMDRRPSAPLTCHRVPDDLAAAMRESAVPRGPAPAERVLEEATDLMYRYSLFTSHPRFLGYVCPAADPLGVLADTLTTAVNPNAASAMMTPIGYVLEKTVIRWLATILGLPADAGGILVSGGNTANLVGVISARDRRSPWPVREYGFDHPDARPLRVYATREAHGGIGKAVEVAGLGRNALCTVAADQDGRMRVDALAEAIRRDRAAGRVPVCVVATIGTVGTGAIDPLPGIVEVARTEQVSVHVDGSYGAAMALAPEVPPEFQAMPDVDSVSWDPHKWLRVPIEAGCIILQDPQALTRSFGDRPTYYSFGDYADTVHYYEQGLQNTRFLRALKVWASLRQHGTDGHRRMIGRDLALNRRFFAAIDAYPRLEKKTCNLCVSTFRYRPAAGPAAHDTDRLNEINAEILHRTQQAGDFYLSNTEVGDEFLLRACFVNYTTEEADIPRILEGVVATGDEVATDLAA